ncbi:MAG: TRAP transporter small permease subunit [Bacteroidota bacterium]
MNRIIAFLDQINEFVGKAISWLTLLLVLLICADVFMRYVFDFTLIWIIELEIYFFAFIFLLGAGYTLKHNRHVRVDLFYDRFSPRQKAWVDLIGAVLFLIPWCLIVIWVGFQYANRSFLIAEKSAQAGGLSALFILKSAIPIAFCLLLIQALSSILTSIQTLSHPPEVEEN